MEWKELYNVGGYKEKSSKKYYSIRGQNSNSILLQNKDTCIHTHTYLHTCVYLQLPFTHNNSKRALHYNNLLDSTRH
jgi:hypothetical protein